MTTSRAIILLLAIGVLATTWSPPCWAAQKDKDKENIWTEEPRGRRRGPRPGPPRFELTDEEIDRIMKELKEKDPKKAKELAKLREEDPAKFQAELRRHGREEFGKIIRERIDTWRRKRQAEFLEWLGKNYRKEAQELSKLKENEDVYWKKFDHIREKYWRIFEEEGRNPELAEVLKEDLELKEKRNELIRKIKAAKSGKDKKKLAAQLEEVVSRRFDLIVRRKQIAYERLLKWLEQLQKRIRESRDELKKWRTKEFKTANVKKRCNDLTEGIPKFSWD